MMGACSRGVGAGLLALVVGLLAGGPPARAIEGEPLRPFSPFYASFDVEGSRHPSYPAPGGFEGPCGLAAEASTNRFYVSDYYHRHTDSATHAVTRYVDAFEGNGDFLTKLLAGNEADGPCGLAIGPAGTPAEGTLYVNDYHRDVTMFAPAAFPLAQGTAYGTGTPIDTAEPTGVAVGADGRVYVDDRSYVAVYEPSGAPVESGGEPLRIGVGSIGDGYGVAVSRHAATEGYVYVADASDDTVKAFDPSLDAANPVLVIDGHETPGGGFVSLRDSALTVVPSSGELYLADDLQPEYRECPEAAIYAFDGASGEYHGRLAYNVVDARPPGLAASNTRVYVTSGNTEGAVVYAYPSGSVVKAVTPVEGRVACRAPARTLEEAAAGGAIPAASATRDAAAATAAGDDAAAPAGASEVAQKRNLRVRVAGAFSPQALPRNGAAPIAVTFGGRISTTDGSEAPQLKQMRIEFNRLGRLSLDGLPTCRESAVQPASSARALAACRGALVGQGSFRANVVLSGQAPYPTKGRMLVFNGSRHGRPLLLGQIYAPKPFPTSFLIRFEIGHIAHGRYGTALTASLPQALGDWGHVTAISLRLSRRFSYRGHRRSVLSAGCPAPQGFPGALFPLARMRFSFAGGTRLSSVLTRSCRAR